MVELLSTKIYIPRARENLVVRRRLTDRLNAGLDKKLTLISAPAGFGKTTLLSEWIPRSPRCVTWLSLDETDNDPTQFWTYFIASLQMLRPSLGASASNLLQSPQSPPITSTLITLINDLTSFPDNFAIVLDDYHLIKFQPIHESLTYLIDHLPANMHLIITTRADPHLPLARLRARNQLNEFRANDLRFTESEPTDFLNQVMGLNLSPEEIDVLEIRTEGWIAGLQIAALSMQSREDNSVFIQNFSGSHRHLLGYLAEEVLNQRPAGTLNFLLQTSIVDRLCGSLCDAITGETGGQTILENLVETNLFISSLDDEGIWYRYHHLFAEVLRVRAQRSIPERLSDLHNRARIWFEQNGLKHEAVNHAIVAGDFEQAAYLIEQLVGDKWQAGELNTLTSWLAALPETAWGAHPRLWLVQAWIAMSVGDFGKADTYLRSSEKALSMLDKETSRSLQPEILAQRASYASLMQEPNAIGLALQALDLLPADYWMRGMLVVLLGAAYYTAGDLEAALDALDKAPVSNLPESDPQPHQIHLLAFSATVHYAKGSLRKALKHGSRAVELAEPGGNPIPFIGTLFAYMALVPILYERGEIDQARDYSTKCLEMAENFGSHEVQVYTLGFLVRISIAMRDYSEAGAYDLRIEALLGEHAFSNGIQAYVDYHRFNLYLKQRNLAKTGAWVAARVNQFGPLNAYAYHRIASPQYLIEIGDFSTAMDELSALIQEAETTGHGSLLVKGLILQSLTFNYLGKSSDALTTLARALEWAELEGFIRSFVDEGEPMQRLLEEFRTNPQQNSHGGFRQDSERTLRYADKLLAEFVETKQTHQPVPGMLVEALSERELEILNLIVSGHTNQEIAEILVIAVSTVKSHINSLYGKLGIQRRTQAVAMARELGLIYDR